MNLSRNFADDPDAALLLEAKKGDLSSFEAILNKYQKPIYNFFLRFFGNPTQAEDAAQQLFLQLYRSLSRYQPLAKFSTYLYRMAHNLAINISRRNSILSFFSLDDIFARPEDIPDRKLAGPLEKLEKREKEEMIQKALLELPARQRSALLMFYFEDQSMEEIARSMACSIGSVESLLSRGRKTLKKTLRLACFWLAVFLAALSGLRPLYSAAPAFKMPWMLLVIPENERFVNGGWLKVLEKSSRLKVAVAFSANDLSQMEHLRGRLMELKAKGKLEPWVRLDGDPILPLIYDLSISRAFLDENVPLPQSPIAWPEDVLSQVADAQIKHQSFWDEKAKGFVAGGGCLSLEICDLLKQEGFLWTVGAFPEKEWPSGYAHQLPSVLGQPFKVFPANSRSQIFYSTIDGASSKAAVRKMLEDLTKVPEPIPPILVYDEARSSLPFPQLLEEIDRNLPWFENSKMVLADSFPSIREERRSSLVQIWPYSWPWMKSKGEARESGLRHWVGDSEKNLVWELLYQTRQLIEQYKNSGLAELKKLDQAMKEFYMAESSKFYEGSYANKKKEFERKILFKATLANIYRILGQPIPFRLESPSSELQNRTDLAKELKTQNGKSIQLETKRGFAQWSVFGSSTATVLEQFSVELSSSLSNGAEVVFSWVFNPNATEVEILDLYIDLNRRSGAGNTAMFPGRLAQVTPQDAWESGLSCEKGEGGWECRLFQGKGAFPTYRTQGGKKGANAMEVRIPQRLLGKDPLRWGYLVCIIEKDTGAILDFLGRAQTHAENGRTQTLFSTVQIE